ncbi:hypothetical protein [Dactylosporangium sp. CS-033363]|uniref:hypothetical protein n=1 Tax=Dactylosporangium sp. CS-033363 TaxID=3239935 RepID=UPI003D902899
MDGVAMISPDEIGAWLGSPVVETIMRTGNLAVVHVLRLGDGRTVVVKARAAEERLAGCAFVHRHLWRAGFTCPELIAGPTRFGELALSAEIAVERGTGPVVGQVPGAGDGAVTSAPSDGRVASGPGNGQPGSGDGAARGPGAAEFSALLARLIGMAPKVGETPSLAPAPAWIRWYHDDGAIWPWPDDRDADLHLVASWHDAAAVEVRRLLGRFGAEPVIGHCDFEAHNIWWRGDQPLAVHDWDSVVAEPEAVIVGVAAAMWPAGDGRLGATVRESAEFLDGYQRARGRGFSGDEVRAAWAAGLWIRLFNAKKWALDGLDALGQDEAEVRAHMAGL